MVTLEPITFSSDPPNNLLDLQYNAPSSVQKVEIIINILGHTTRGVANRDPQTGQFRCRLFMDLPEGPGYYILCYDNMQVGFGQATCIVKNS